MQEAQILYPVFLLVLLTFFIMIWMGHLRVRAVKHRELPPAYFKHNRGAKPGDQLMSVTQNFENLLETPILFYAVVLFLLQQNAVTEFSITVAWIYTGLRYLHSIVHTTYNHILHRLLVFTLSLVALGMLWGQLVSHVMGNTWGGAIYP